MNSCRNYVLGDIHLDEVLKMIFICLANCNENYKFYIVMMNATLIDKISSKM